MASHTAKSLFDLNIQSAKDSIALYDAIAKLKPQEMNIDWVLRAAVVFAVSALDTYFHDKVKYKVGKYDLGNLPPALARFEIQIRALSSWDQARRKGNVLRNWVTDDLATRPLQSPTAIAEALKLGGIENLWKHPHTDKGGVVWDWKVLSIRPPLRCATAFCVKNSEGTTRGCGEALN